MTRRPLQGLTALVLVGWFLFVAYLGASGYFLTAEGSLGLSAVQLSIVVPAIVFWMVYFLVPPVREFLQTADITFLVAIQVARILALSHLVLWGYGLMAGGFAVPVAAGNFLVFVLALAAVPAVAQYRPGWRRRVYLVTFVGLLEFLMTIGLAVFGVFAVALPIDPQPSAFGYVDFRTPPLSLFPTFAIPAMTIAHFVTILALRAQQRKHSAAS